MIPYSLINIDVVGYTDDTIKIIIKEEYERSLKLSGKIDTILKFDYYGENSRTFLFDPYRAKKGKLKINYSL